MTMTYTAPLLDNDSPESTGMRPMRRSEGIAYLMRNGDLDCPCSPYGRKTRDNAEVAWRLAYVWAGVALEGIDHDILDWAMGLVVNDSDIVRQVIREHGHRMYR